MKTTSRLALLAGLAGAGAISACGDYPTQRACTAIAVDALAVTVVDTATGQRICDATVEVTDGSFRETLRPFGPSGDCNYSGPTERAGLYDIRASRAGYRDGIVRGQRVTADECHVIPVRVEVRLATP